MAMVLPPSPPLAADLELGASPQSLTAAGADQEPPQVNWNRHQAVATASVEIMGLELFLEPSEDSSDSQSEYDSYAFDSIVLRKTGVGRSGLRPRIRNENAREDRPVDSEASVRGSGSSSDGSYSFARDSQVLHHQRYVRTTVGVAAPAQESESYLDDDDSDSSSSSQYDDSDDIKDSLHFAHAVRHRPSHRVISRRNSVHADFRIQGAGVGPHKLADCASMLKRRSSIDNGNIVTFSPELLITQHINSGGVNAAA